MRAREARIGIGLLLSAVAVTGCSDDPPRTGSRARPNVLIVVLDTLRADRLAMYGAARDTAPGLDVLAERSIVFEDAQSAAPLTVASLLSLMTALHPEAHGIQGAPNPGRMSESVTTLAEVLQEHGYATAAFTEGGYARPDFGLGQGFQTYPRPPDDDRPNVSDLLTESRLGPNLERTVAWLRAPRTQPFFLFYHTYEIHSPYWTKPDNVRLFRPDFDEAADHERVERIITQFNADRTFTREDCLVMLKHLYQCSLQGLPRLQHPDEFARAAHAFGLGPEDAVRVEPLLELVRDLYDASIRTTDDALETLWRTLADLKLEEDTIVVVLSDHGEGLGDHGEMEHANVLHEETLRVPLFFHVPGGKLAPRRVRELVRTIDVMPTLLELLGIEAGSLPMQGKSLVPLLSGKSDAERLAFSHARRVVPGQPPQYSVCDGRWRLIDEPASSRRWLYDRDADPRELHDVLAQHPAEATRLLEALEKQLAQDRWIAKQLGSAPQPLHLDPKAMKDLHDLGYGGGAPSPPPRTDPK